jgi:predicted TIM-barrel fold metal-dependent hydrolase
MRRGFRVLDADLHTFEPHDLWERHLEPRFRARAPRIPAGRPFDPASHLRAMDAEGIDVAILFGTRGRHVQMRDDLDPELAEAMARAHNDWTSEFCSADAARLKFAAQVPYVDPERAAREAARAVRERGAVAIIGNPNPVNGRHLHDPSCEPLWETAEALGVPVCFHPTGVWGLRDDVGARFTGHAAAHMLTNAARNPMELMLALASLAMGGVLERHPSLKCAFLEGGAGWLPWWLHRLDATREKFPEDVDVELSRRPSAYFLRQCFIAADPDEPGLPHVVAALGDANIVFGSDYPHRDSLHPVAVETLAGREDLRPAAKARILWDNAARLFARAIDASEEGSLESSKSE